MRGADNGKALLGSPSDVLACSLRLTASIARLLSQTRMAILVRDALVNLQRALSVREQRNARIQRSWFLEKMERARRFERPTPTLARLCSTPELRPLTDALRIQLKQLRSLGRRRD